MTAAEVTGWLDRLAETHKAATPGPWRWDADFGDEADTGLALTNDAGEEIVGAYNTHCCAFRDDPIVNDADAAAVVAAHNALPQLVAAVRGVLNLHQPAHPEGPTSCLECNKGRKFVPWPCPTFSAVAAALGAEVTGR